MAATVLYMSMSLDGFVTGPNPGPGNALGDGGMVLHDWVLEGTDLAEGDVPTRPDGVNGELYDEFMSTGAVVSGRGTAEPASFWGGDHHDGVPIFILSRGEPTGDAAEMPLVTFVDDIEKAMADAKSAAGDKDVLVHGASTLTKLALEAGVLDEIQIHQVPVLLGGGRRLFEDLGPEGPEVERVRAVEGENGIVHLRYRVKK